MVSKNIKSWLPLDVKTWVKTLIIVVIAAALGITAKMAGLFGRLRGKL